MRTPSPVWSAARTRSARRWGRRCWGRLMDHFGQVAVLVPTAASSAALLVGLALATTWGAPDYALITIAAAVGLSYPAISPALRSSFRIVLPDPGARRVAFALGCDFCGARVRLRPAAVVGPVASPSSTPSTFGHRRPAGGRWAGLLPDGSSPARQTGSSGGRVGAQSAHDRHRPADGSGLDRCGGRPGCDVDA